MDPRWPRPSAPPPRASYARSSGGSGGSGGAAPLRLKRLEPFQGEHDTPGRAPEHVGPRRPSAARKSLSTMRFDPGVVGVTELFTLHPRQETDPELLRQPSRSSSSSSSSATSFIANLRSKTLLDYTFMREFSLAKRKPLAERNLSKMSAQSVYSMRMAQLELETQGRRMQTLTLPAPDALAIGTESPHSAKADGDERPAERADAASLDSARLGSTGPERGQSPIPSGAEAPPGLRLPLRRGDTDNGRLVLIYRQSQGTTDTKPPTARPPAFAQQPSRRLRQQQQQPSESVCRPMVAEGLSEFDRRKCHSAVTVTAQHGHLLEQDLPRLLEETGYDRTELYALWGRFKALCSLSRTPDGIDKETFHRGIPQLSVEDQFFIDRVFDILDADGSGILEWPEFVEALSSLENGDMTTRVQFLFRVYDLNGDGTIHRHEVTQFFLASLLTRANDELRDVARHFVGKIFEAVGCADREMMRVEDALRYMHEHPTADIYSLFGRTMVTKRAKLDVRRWHEHEEAGAHQTAPAGRPTSVLGS